MDEITNFYDNASVAIGFPADQLRFLTCMILAYPGAYIFRLLPNSPNVKHIYSIIFSITLCVFCLGPYAWLHTVFTSLVTYFLMRFLPKGTAHKVNFVFLLGYMSFSHIYRMSVDYMGWTLDFTTQQMILTIKLSSFGFNYYDGQNSDDATSEQKKRSIRKLPNLLEYFGFVFFFPSYMAGPPLEITEYQNFISGFMFKDDYCKGKTPHSFYYTFKSLLTGFLLLPLMILGGTYPLRYLLTQEYMNASVAEQVFRLWLHPTLCRMKYYFGWFVAEGAFIASGIGYNGVDKQGKPQWNRFCNAHFWGVEAAPNMRSITTYWNLRTADWLKHYIYLRLTPEGSRPPMSTTIITYAVSAFWHGFYPGYYLFFIFAGVITEVGKDLRRILRPFFVNSIGTENYPLKYGYDISCILTTALFMNYCGVSFLLLSLEDPIKLYTHFYYWGHIIPVIVLIASRTVFASVGRKKRV